MGYPAGTNAFPTTMKRYFKSLVVAYFVARAYAGITYAFPDCTTAPLKGNAVCDTTKDPVTRAQAIIAQFTVDELMANTVNLSPGVPRLGLPSYQWWSEALVSLFMDIYFSRSILEMVSLSTSTALLAALVSHSHLQAKISAPPHPSLSLS